MTEFYKYLFILGFIPQNKPLILSIKDNSSITNSLIISTLISCYPERRTIVLCDSDSIIQSLWMVPTISVILHNNSKISSAASKKLNKMNLFLLSFRSEEQFNDTLWSLKSSPWWNIMATFFILDQSKGTCRDAEIALKTVWSINIPTSIFICNNSRKILIFTFNPYTRWAPESWKQVATVIQKDDRWTLYSRPFYQKGYKICKNLQFDRSQNLDGYKVKATSVIFYSNSVLVKSGYDSSKLGTADFVRIDISNAFEKSLNINLSVHYFEYNYQDPECIYQGLGEGLYDLTLGVLPMHAIDNFPLLFPFIAYETTTIMQKRGYYTPLEKIQKYYGIITVISVTTVLTIVFIVILISQKRKGLNFAIFEILRLLVNSSLFSKINKLPLRIFFFVIFVFFLIIHATFSGNLSAFLTKQELRITPETLRNLGDSYIKVIYLPKNLSFDYSNPKISDKVVLIDNYDCGTVVLNNTAAVCLNDRPDLISLAAQYKNLRVSKKPLASDFYSFIARKDWPLKNRAELVVLRFLESGHSLSFWKKKVTEEKEDNMKRADERSYVKYRPVSLLDCKFAFVILAFGHVFGVVSFFSEILISHVQKRSTTAVSSFRLNT